MLARTINNECRSNVEQRVKIPKYLFRVKYKMISQPRNIYFKV